MGGGWEGKGRVLVLYLGVSVFNEDTWLNMFLCSIIYSFIHSLSKHFLRPILAQTLPSRYEQWKIPLG